MESRRRVEPNIVKDIMSKPYVRRLVPDESGGYVGSIFEFPGCFAEGDSTEEAMSNLNKAAESWIESALSTGYEIREPVSFDGCSGKIALRVPRSLHRQVAELAELEDTSINQLLVAAVASYVGTKKAYEAVSFSLLGELKRAVRDGLAHLYHNGSLSITVELPTEPHFHHGTTIPQRPNLVARELIALPG